jgi:phosphoglycolate phosphatase-like HAD superfamily hydrolase
MNSNKKILALDFDGVICDGLAEYFATTKKAYNLIWKSEQKLDLEKFREQFYRLRPVIETGWEMPVLLFALTLEIPEQEISNNWSKILTEIINKYNINPSIIAQIVDQVRDNWIKNDLQQWLLLHRIYPEIKQQLTSIINQNISTYIISTKEGRFIKEILQQAVINIPESNIFGKECKRPKYETISLILKKNNVQPENLIFIEDRIEPLEKIHQISELKKIQLYLATWGYNTEKTRQKAKISGYIQLLNLPDPLPLISNSGAPL